MARLGGHLYQSRAWGQFQAAQGRAVWTEAAADWSWLAALRRGRGGITYLYAAYGPTVRQSGLADALASLAAAGRAAGADFVRLEPMGQVEADQLIAAGARPVADVQPRYRLVLDITASEADLRHNISSSNRNLINTAEKRGLSFVISQDPAQMADYLAMQRETAARDAFRPQSDQYYDHLAQSLLPSGAAKLYFVYYEGQPVASAICADFAGTRYYVYAATYPQQNRQLKAAIALLWWMIMDAKAQGLTHFDYGGIAPDDQPNHAWVGHTKFKRSIGGETVATIGTWDLPLKAGKYRLYQLARKVVPL